jgi:hypothetical protein
VDADTDPDDPGPDDPGPDMPDTDEEDEEEDKLNILSPLMFSIILMMMMM